MQGMVVLDRIFRQQNDMLLMRILNDLRYALCVMCDV
jgi:hypothetical protein